MVATLDGKRGTVTKVRTSDKGTTPRADIAETPQNPNEGLEDSNATKARRADEGDPKEANTNVQDGDIGGVSLQKRKDRIALAQRLLELAKKLIVNHGTVKLAADLQLLRRELARGHAVLSGSKAENDYLSIITLVEGSIESLDWKSVQKQQLEEIKNALAVGCGDTPVTFDSFNRTARRLRGSNVPTLPVFDIDEEEKTEATDTSAEKT